jgi:hypothetical protein
MISGRLSTRNGQTSTRQWTDVDEEWQAVDEEWADVDEDGQTSTMKTQAMRTVSERAAPPRGVSVRR